MARPTHHCIMAMASIEELVFAARCADRRVHREDALRLIVEEADRRVRLALVLEIRSRVSRPAGLLSALKFAGPLTASEIRYVLNSLPGQKLHWTDPDADDGHVDLAIDRLRDLGFRVTTARANRLTPEGAIREYRVYELEGANDEGVD